MTPAIHLGTTRLWRAAAPLACLLAGPALAQAPGPGTVGQTPAAPVSSTQAAPSAQVAPAGEHGPVADGPVADGTGRTRAPADAYDYIGWPSDGTVVRSSRFKVWFGARNIGVAPAGVANPNTGHHHLLVDAPLPDDMTVAIPNDRNHLHFGAGQTETVLELPPGKHTLQLLMGDANHVPHDPPVYSRKVTIFVRPGPAARTVAVQ